MSDFASLLKELQTSSQRAATAPSTTGNSIKRPRSPSDSKIYHPPRDFYQLSVTVDFMCIGAQKAGTTWLYEMLCKIPDVGLPECKEVHFWDWHRRQGLRWYSRQFPKGRNLVLGEITPCYMALKERDVMEIHGLFPDARIIFLARDLVDRAWSALTMELRNEARGLQAGEFDIAYDQMDVRTRNKLQHDSDPKNYDDDYFMSRLKTRTHTDRSDYAAALSKFLVHFPSDQILVLNFEDISEHPKELLTGVLEHIGVKNIAKTLEKLDKSDLERRVNPTIQPNQSIRPSLRREMEDYLRPLAVEFNKLVKKNWPEVNWELSEYSSK